MRFDPMTTYSSLIPGGLHYLPGGLFLPPQPHMRNKDALPDPVVPRTALAVRRKNGIWAIMKKIFMAALSPIAP